MRVGRDRQVYRTEILSTVGMHIRTAQYAARNDAQKMPLIHMKVLHSLHVHDYTHNIVVDTHY